MQCNHQNVERKIDEIMCGRSKNDCTSDQWCTDSWDEKQSYWSNSSVNSDANCYSQGV